MNVESIKRAWAEWNAASAATDAAWNAVKSAERDPDIRGRAARKRTARKAWEATLPRTDAAREALRGLPDLDEVATYEAEQAAIAAEDARQGNLF